MHWQTTRFRIDLTRPRVMGIVNVTPDSFSDGGRHATSVAAIAHARRLVDEGADILDIGGESTRPGAAPVSVEEELARVLPVIEGTRELGVPLSVDTLKAEVMRAAIAAGVDIVNDVQALRRTGALEAVAASASVGVCLMHMRGDPRTMQQQTGYDDVLTEVAAFLRERLAALSAAGISAERVVLDPGIGFGKTPEQSMTALARLDALSVFGLPILVGASRKRFIASVSPSEPQDRIGGSIAAHVIAAQRGARIIRTHDVAATLQALRVTEAIESKR